MRDLLVATAAITLSAGSVLAGILYRDDFATHPSGTDLAATGWQNVMGHLELRNTTGFGPATMAIDGNSGESYNYFTKAFSTAPEAGSRITLTARVHVLSTSDQAEIGLYTNNLGGDMNGIRIWSFGSEGSAGGNGWHIQIVDAGGGTTPVFFGDPVATGVYAITLDVLGATHMARATVTDEGGGTLDTGWFSIGTMAETDLTGVQILIKHGVWQPDAASYADITVVSVPEPGVAMSLMTLLGLVIVRPRRAA